MAIPNIYAFLLKFGGKFRQLHETKFNLSIAYPSAHNYRDDKSILTILESKHLHAKIVYP